MVELRLSDFFCTVNTATGPVKKELFPKCEDFLEKAIKLVEGARSIWRAKHAGQPLTMPPD
jgi:hypothetical protein